MKLSYPPSIAGLHHVPCREDDFEAGKWYICVKSGSHIFTFGCSYLCVKTDVTSKSKKCLVTNNFDCYPVQNLISDFIEYEETKHES